LGSSRHVSEPEIPEDVRALLRTCVTSYEELEVLLLLAREPGDAVTAAAVADRVRTPVSAVAAALGTLVDAGLVEAGPGGDTFRYQPRAELGAAVARLLEEARENPVAIIRAMSANAIERIRMSAVNMFADAFVLGRDGSKRDSQAKDRDTTDG
jgi:DNA-binding MarR family transcriptional regulator